MHLSLVFLKVLGPCCMYCLCYSLHVCKQVQICRQLTQAMPLCFPVSEEEHAAHPQACLCCAQFAWLA